MEPDAALSETTGCLCLASRRAARAITREFDSALRSRGLRATQFTLLAALHLTGPRSIGELAELLSADRTTLTRNLAVAEQHGWVVTRPGRDDARARIAAIAPKGSRVLKAALPAWRKVQQRLLGEIGPRAAESLRRLAGGACALPAPHLQTGREQP
jgi:DNA-binding MarR family transcriptional regulator